VDVGSHLFQDILADTWRQGCCHVPQKPQNDSNK
jgi:hypothetical protein